MRFFSSRRGWQGVVAVIGLLVLGSAVRGYVQREDAGSSRSHRKARRTLPNLTEEVPGSVSENAVDVDEGEIASRGTVEAMGTTESEPVDRPDSYPCQEPYIGARLREDPKLLEAFESGGAVENVGTRLNFDEIEEATP